MSRPRIAWFTPLQPVESGISLYSEDILPILSQVVDVDVFLEGYRPSVLSETESLRIRDARSFDPYNFDLVIYQVGNSPAHIYMLEHLETTPGLLVLHDTMVNHLFIQQAARKGTLTQYRDEMERRYGSEGRRAAERVLQGQAPEDLFKFPMSERLVEASLATVVHSNYARDQVSQLNPEATVERVPHGLHLPELVSREEARRAIGIPLDQFLIASISHINPHKRIDIVLRALKELRKSTPARLMLAGSVSPLYPLQRMISHLSLDQVVETPGYVSDQQARLIAASADVIVNLRYPTAGETSGSLLHSMAAGRPVLVSQTGSFTETPPGSVIPVPVDALEQDSLLAIFRELAANPELRDQVGRRARSIIEEEHSLSRWANGYVDVIARLTGLELEYPNVDEPKETVIGNESAESSRSKNELTTSIARDVAELGLGGDERVLGDVATAQVELGLGVGMISPEPFDFQTMPGGDDVD